MSFDVPGWLVTGDSDAAILTALLELQAGTVSIGQLRTVGVGRDSARSFVRTGRWQLLHRGVLAAFSGPVDRSATMWAALLRCGEGATLSHQSAAELHGFGDADDAIHVTVPAPRRVRGPHPGVVVHHAHRLAETLQPVAQPPRTRVEATVLDLVDVAPSPHRAEVWIVSACQRRLTTPSRLAAHLAERKKIRWRAMAEAMLLDVAAGAHSMLETEHLRAVERAHRLPAGDRQRRVAGNKVTGSRVIWVDVDYDAFTLRVELDGRLGHQDEGAFRDRRRDNRGVVGGRATLRYGHAEVFGDPCGVAAEQAEVMRARGWAGAAVPCRPGCRAR